MKSLLILIISCSTLFLNAQNNKLVPNWMDLENESYLISHEVDERISNAIKNHLYNYSAKILSIHPVGEHYLMEWQLFNFSSSNANKYLRKYIASFPRLNVKVKIDRQGQIVELANIKDLKKQINKEKISLRDYFEPFTSGQEKKLTLGFEVESGIRYFNELKFLRSLLQFYTCFGLDYNVQTHKQKITQASLIPNLELFNISGLRLITAKPSDHLSLVVSQFLDKEELRKNLKEVYKSLRSSEYENYDGEIKDNTLTTCDLNHKKILLQLTSTREARGVLNNYREVVKINRKTDLKELIPPLWKFDCSNDNITASILPDNIITGDIGDYGVEDLFNVYNSGLKKGYCYENTPIFYSDRNNSIHVLHLDTKKELFYILPVNVSDQTLEAYNADNIKEEERKIARNRRDNLESEKLLQFLKLVPGYDIVRKGSNLNYYTKFCRAASYPKSVNDLKKK